MKKLLAILTAVLIVCLAAGCSNEKEKGQYRDKDKPRAGEAAIRNAECRMQNAE